MWKMGEKECREPACLPAATVIVQMRRLFTFVACYTLATCTRLYCCWVWAPWVHRNLSVFNHLYFHLSLACAHMHPCCLFPCLILSRSSARAFSFLLFFVLPLSLYQSLLTISSPICIQGSSILEYRTSLTFIFHLFCSKQKMLHFCLLVHWIEQRNNRIQKFLSTFLCATTFLYVLQSNRHYNSTIELPTKWNYRRQRKRDLQSQC